jgi:hypothetical protein
LKVSPDAYPEWAGAVDSLLVGIERYSGCIKFCHGVGDVQDAPAKPVDGPAHHHSKFSPDCILEHLVEG